MTTMEGRNIRSVIIFDEIVDLETDIEINWIKLIGCFLDKSRKLHENYKK